jgi:hypothetical protein
MPSGRPAGRAEQLGPAQAERLEHGEVAPPALYPAEQYVSQGADAKQGEDGAQDERGVPHAGVVLDVARPLVGGDQA